MLIYEVNLEVNNAILPSYLIWLKNHIAQMLRHKGFMDATVHKLDLSADLIPRDTTTLVVQYHVDTTDSLKDYFEHHAASMRQDGLNKFSGQFKATRRILERFTF